jgi:hypothetical protein
MWSQGNTAGLTLGLLSLCLTAGCAVYLAFNRMPRRARTLVADLACLGPCLSAAHSHG